MLAKSRTLHMVIYTAFINQQILNYRIKLDRENLTKDAGRSRCRKKEYKACLNFYPLAISLNFVDSVNFTILCYTIRWLTRNVSI